MKHTVMISFQEGWETDVDLGLDLDAGFLVGTFFTAGLEALEILGSGEAEVFEDMLVVKIVETGGDGKS